MLSYWPATVVWYTLLLPFVTAQASHQDSQNATVFALLYGYPLLSFQKLAPAMVETVGANYLVHGRTLSTAANRAVVKPNVDTLYSTMIFDLSQNDLVVTIPDIPRNRFHLFSYYDAFGNNFANTGTLNHDVAGDYLLRRVSDATSAYGVQLTDNGTSAGSNSTQYQAYVNSPTTYGVFLIRWLVQNSSAYDIVHGFQNATHVTPQVRPLKEQTSPTLKQIEQEGISGSPAEAALRLLAVFASSNQPEIEADSATVTSNLSLAGIKNGTYTTPAGVNLTLANNTAVLFAAEAISSPDAIRVLNNGWSMMTPNLTGDFRSNYGLRTAIAASGYLMLKAPNALYPSWANDSSGSGGSGLSNAAEILGPNDSYLFTFSAKPPLQDTGFWSLTAYADNYLIPNDRNVYDLGDRSNLTYSDGTSVYRNATDHNGAFQILVQPADIPPPQNWTDNWLPGPAAGGSIQLVLRWYGATDSLTNGQYVYPKVTKQAAIIANASNFTPASSSSQASPTYTGGGTTATTVPPGASLGCFITLVLLLSASLAAM